MDVILASASPRRRELLRLLFDDFEIIAPRGEENADCRKPEDYVMELSRKKAVEAAGRIQEKEALILGADTVVVSKDGRGKDMILGKPEDERDAAKMLEALSGKTHRVVTGVTLLYPGTQRGPVSRSFYEETAVTFAAMTEQEIAGYVATKEPMDKAGAYGIQGGASKFITSIQGDFFNVVGLPVARIYRELCRAKLV